MDLNPLNGHLDSTPYIEYDQPIDLSPLNGHLDSILYIQCDQPSMDLSLPEQKPRINLIYTLNVTINGLKTFNSTLYTE